MSHLLQSGTVSRNVIKKESRLYIIRGNSKLLRLYFGFRKMSKYVFFVYSRVPFQSCAQKLLLNSVELLMRVGGTKKPSLEMFRLESICQPHFFAKGSWLRNILDSNPKVRISCRKPQTYSKHLKTKAVFMQPGHLHHTATRQLRSYDRDEIGLVHLDRHRSSSIRLQAQRQRSQNWPEWFASSQPIQEQHGTTAYNPLQPLYPILSGGCTACHESS